MDTPTYTRSMSSTSSLRALALVVIVTLIAGVGVGFLLSMKSSSNGNASLSTITNSQPKTASQDNRTFRDFAEGTVTVKPTPKDPNAYSEGTHLLVRPNSVPVALTSSVVDLSKYEGKKVKVFGETQKALKEGWLMDVGKVEVQN